ncbi:MAG: hypoxanthine phosphoribosyltransferase [Candidatus Latescibacteria bacterium]|nr:hypoxanthine phosphoribosyltransferase [Candidatus Latescibacterota bacterium]
MDHAPLQVLIDRETLHQRVAQLAGQVAADYPDSPPLMVGVLNGAVHFMMELLACLPEAFAAGVEYDFVGVSSYSGGESQGQVRLTKDVGADLGGREVLIVDGIVDTGLTVDFLLARFRDRNPRSLKVCALLDKPARRRHPVPVHYRGFAIEDVFVVGYGMDYDQRYRALNYIGVLGQPI